MIPEQRYKIILETLQKEGTVKASDLARQLSTSYETIRRDLQHLDSEGLLHRSPGGASAIETSPESVLYENFQMRLKQEPAHKKDVALLAAELISEGDIIALDSGSTSLILARVIHEKFHQLTVITNSIPAAGELVRAEGITIILTGGIYRRDEGSLVTDIDSSIVDRLNIHTFFLTACGLSIEKGVTYQRMDELAIQNQLMRHAERTNAITDSSKIGRNSLIRMCSLSDIAGIITDENASDAQILPFTQHGIPVMRNIEEIPAELLQH